jgi:transaldolase
LSALNVRIFADGADLCVIRELARAAHISGFTTNPTLMHRAGVRDYRAFARELVRLVPDKPISFEVFSDDFEDMERQADEIAGWGEHVYVKIPVTNTRGQPSLDLIARLSRRGVQVNVTAVLTSEQARRVADRLSHGVSAYISIFAGRVADTGRDPLPIVADTLHHVRGLPDVQVIWASPRELLNIMHAEQVGCHIITVTADLLTKLHLLGRELEDYSLDTVRMFHMDALEAGFSL